MPPPVDEPEALQLQEPDASDPEAEVLHEDELLSLFQSELLLFQPELPPPSFQPGHGSEQEGTPWPPVSTNAALAQAWAPTSQYQSGLPFTLWPLTTHWTRS